MCKIVYEIEKMKMPFDISFKSLSFNGNEVVLLCIYIHKKTDISFINAVMTNRFCEMIKIHTCYFASDPGNETVITS